jgi:DNA repair ATPase RecN
MRCKLYQNEFERKISCIAHGREPDDPEITAEVLKQQFEPVEKLIEQYMEEHDINFDSISDAEYDEIEKIDERMHNHLLQKTAEQYRKKADTFLKNTFYEKENLSPRLVYDFETVAWYHTLLAVKLHRALCGFYEPVDEHEFGLHDAIAQFAICKKAINESVKALRKLKPYYLDYKNLIAELLALLHNILSRIEAMEESI